jgi:hypothetical protein
VCPPFKFLSPFIYFHEIWYMETNKITHKTVVRPKKKEEEEEEEEE